jgi:hypothetical protein
MKIIAEGEKRYVPGRDPTTIHLHGHDQDTND